TPSSSPRSRSGASAIATPVGSSFSTKRRIGCRWKRPIASIANWRRFSTAGEGLSARAPIASGRGAGDRLPVQHAEPAPVALHPRRSVGGVEREGFAFHRELLANAVSDDGQIVAQEANQRLTFEFEAFDRELSRGHHRRHRLLVDATGPLSAGNDA